MTYTPIIIPVNTTRECIVQDGTRYCEHKDISKKDLGLAGGILLGIILWSIFWIWVGHTFDKEILAGLCAIVIPCVIAILYALI